MADGTSETDRVWGTEAGHPRRPPPHRCLEGGPPLPQGPLHIDSLAQSWHQCVLDRSKGSPLPARDPGAQSNPSVTLPCPEPGRHTCHPLGNAKALQSACHLARLHPWDFGALCTWSWL